LQDDEATGKTDPGIDPTETDALGIETWLLAAAHANRRLDQPNGLERPEIANDHASEKTTQAGCKPYATAPMKP
jgi:hypothetical protein